VVLIASFGLLSQWYVDPSPYERLRHSLFNFLHYFLAGFLLADLYLTRGGGVRRSLTWDVVTAVAAAAIPAVLIRYQEYSFLLPFAVMLLYVGFFGGRIANRLITHRWIVIAGGMCYTFYLYHAMIIVVLMPRTTGFASSSSRPFGVDFWLQCLLIYPVIFVVCSLLFVFVEKPFMKSSRAIGRAPAAT
jgi:peptidoglycan/LPS O-acetylase OafA/YrhL